MLTHKAGVLTVTAGGTVPELRRLALGLSPQSSLGTLKAIQFGYRLSRRERKVKFLYYQHGVAEAVEPVAEAHGLLVSLEDKIPAGEGRNQHKQR